jgi:hypothetical protein
MRQSASLTLRIQKSLYPQSKLDVVGEGYVATCTKDEGSKLVDDSTLTMSRIVEMLLVNMS